MSTAYVYILTNRSKTLYIGVTNNLSRRLFEHRNKTTEGFSTRYNLSRLAYFETHTTMTEAIAREKSLKGWSRAKKLELIESMNPEWKDLSAEWEIG